MKFYNHEEVLDKVLGPKGNIERDEHEANIQSFLMGEALKQARLSKNLTQEELGKMIGVKRAQISRIEKGYNLTLGTISKVLKAICITASLHLNGIGRVILS
jgi:DNA-binding XRE family transcriptional regulator